MPLEAVNREMSHPPIQKIIYLRSGEMLVYDNKIWMLDGTPTPMYQKRQIPEEPEIDISLHYDDQGYINPWPSEDPLKDIA